MRPVQHEQHEQPRPDHLLWRRSGAGRCVWQSTTWLSRAIKWRSIPAFPWFGSSNLGFCVLGSRVVASKRVAAPTSTVGVAEGGSPLHS